MNPTNESIIELIKELDELVLCFSINRNDHKSCYITLEHEGPDVEDFKDKEDYEKCLKEDIAWWVNCCPDTPAGNLGFNGSDIREVLKRTITTIQEDRKERGVKKV